MLVAHFNPVNMKHLATCRASWFQLCVRNGKRNGLVTDDLDDKRLRALDRMLLDENDCFRHEHLCEELQYRLLKTALEISMEIRRAA
jgi:hypothetical protein